MLTARHGHPAVAPTAGRHGASRIARLARAARGALALGRSRAALDDLDDHLLRDIGLTREQARAEARRPIWDGPDHHVR